MSQSYQRQGLDENEEDLAKYCNILREKFEKYMGYIRGITFKDNQFMTVTLGFPLDYMKILMLTLAEQILTKVLIRSVKDIDKCTLIVPEKAGDEPYLLV